MVEMAYGKTEGGRDFVKVSSDEALLISEIANCAIDKSPAGDEPIYCEVTQERSQHVVTVYDVSEAEFDEIFQAARDYTDSLYQQAMQADYESEFPCSPTW